MIRFAQSRVAAAMLAALAAATAALAAMDTDSLAWLPQCPFYAWTGLYCPGCGTTRMLYLLAHGHPLLALHENALSMLLLPVVIYALTRQLTVAVALPRVRLRTGIAVALVTLAFGVVRNLPGEPFRQLAPPPLIDLR